MRLKVLLAIAAGTSAGIATTAAIDGTTFATQAGITGSAIGGETAVLATKMANTGAVSTVTNWVTGAATGASAAAFWPVTAFVGILVLLKLAAVRARYVRKRQNRRLNEEIAEAARVAQGDNFEMMPVAKEVGEVEENLFVGTPSSPYGVDFCKDSRFKSKRNGVWFKKRYTLEYLEPINGLEIGRNGHLRFVVAPDTWDKTMTVDVEKSIKFYEHALTGFDRNSVEGASPNDPTKNIIAIRDGHKIGHIVQILGGKRK